MPQNTAVKTKIITLRQNNNIMVQQLQGLPINTELLHHQQNRAENTQLQQISMTCLREIVLMSYILVTKFEAYRAVI